MKPLLKIPFIGPFLVRHPTEEDEASYREVRCLGEWYHCNPERWREVFLKVCFLCGDKLIIDLRIDDSEQWRVRMEGDRAVLGSWSANYRFLHQGFSVVERKKLDGSVRFYAVRMPRLIWDGKTALNDYEDGVVVTMPLTHLQFGTYWKNLRTEERKKKEQELLRNFSCWQFAPLMYCQTCERVHDGGHRWQVVKQLGWKEVPVRIVRYGRDGPDQHCRNVERRQKALEERSK